MPKDQRKTGRQNYDWAKIQHEYVTNPQMSLRRIAEKYGISYMTVAKKSKADNWFATRKKYQSNVISKAISKTENKMAAELSQEVDFLDKMKGHFDRMISDTQQYQRHLVESKTFDEEGGMDIHTEEKVFNKFDSKAMKDSMQILQMMESMTRSLYNIEKAEKLQKQQLDRERFEFDKEIQRERLELEKERLALERERNALRNGNIGSDNDKHYGVVLIPEVIGNE